MTRGTRAQTQLQRRLAAAVRERYRGSARAASLAIGGNPNLVNGILKNRNHVPEVLTLKAIAEEFDWPFYDTVCWALDTTPAEWADPPLAQLRGALDRLGLSSQQQELVASLVREFVQEEQAEAEELGLEHPSSNAS